MKFMLIVLITMGSPVIGEKSRSFELKIPQESKEQCLNSADTFRFSLPVISIETRCEPRRDDEQSEIREI